MLTLLAPKLIIVSMPRKQRLFSSHGCMGLSITFEKDAIIPRLLFSKKASAARVSELDLLRAGFRDAKMLVKA